MLFTACLPSQLPGGGCCLPTWLTTAYQVGSLVVVAACLPSQLPGGGCCLPTWLSTACQVGSLVVVAACLPSPLSGGGCCLPTKLPTKSHDLTLQSFNYPVTQPASATQLSSCPRAQEPSQPPNRLTAQPPNLHPPLIQKQHTATF